MRAVGDKRGAFARVDLRALDRIDMHVPTRDQVGVRNMYVTLCRVATIEMDAAHDGFDASRRVLMDKGSVSENTLDKHLATLEELGLVEVERRVAAHGGRLPNRYTLLDSPAADEPVTTDRNECPPGNDYPGGNDCLPAANAQPLPPLRARPESQKKEEEGEREGERGYAENSSTVTGGKTEDAVVTEFAALLEARGEQLTAADRFGIRAAIGAAPDGVDPVAAAARLHRHYGPGGKCQRRTIKTLPGLFANELRESAPAATPSSLPGVTFGTAPVATGQRAGGLKVHSERPSLEEPDQRLASAWAEAVRYLEDSRAWCWMWSVGLAGTLTLLVDEAGGESDQPERILVLDADPEQLGWISANAKRCGLLRLLEQVVGDVTVELAPRTNAAAVAA